MRGKCQSLRIAIVVMIVATVLAIIFQFIDLSLYEKMQQDFSEKLQVFLFTMSSGCAASAFATTFILVFEYRNERRKTLERYWQQQIELNSKIKCIGYFSPNIPIELLLKYIGYKRNGRRYTKEDILKEWIEANEEAYDESMTAFYELSVEDEFQNIVSDLNSVLESYKRFRDIDYRVQENTYGDILFLGDIIESSTVWKGLKQWDAIKWIVEKVELRVNSKRNYIYKEIHEPMRDMLKKLKGFDGFIIKYYKNEYSLDFILRTLDKFQKQQKLFGIEEDNTQFTVYADFYDNMDHNIETFRSSILYKCDPEYLPRRTEIMSKLKRIPD